MSWRRRRPRWPRWRPDRVRVVSRTSLPERRPRLAFIFAAVPVLLISGLLLSGPLLYRANTVVSQVFQTPVPVAAGPPDAPEATPLPLPDWDKKERINILLLGLDKREDDEYGRTDTMIVASIDPVTKTVGVMSLPRDLRVTIPFPGYADDKINAAYVFGDAHKYPGGGVGLLKRTIYVNFGINVHYFAQVDFRGFEKVVDTFGGVTVDSPYPLRDDAYPTETNGYVGIYFPPGLQHLDGKLALRYARTRHADSDFGRALRQQQVILALRQQALNRDLSSKFWPLLEILGASVRTDLNPNQAAALVKLAQGIPRENIKVYQLFDLISDYTDPDTGTSYLIPDWPQVRKRVREMVPDAGTGMVAPAVDPKARVFVQNGSGIKGLAGRTVDGLKRGGFAGAVVDLTDVPGILASSVVYDYTGRGDPAFAVARAIGLPESAVRAGSDPPPPGVDILVVLGQDAPDPQNKPLAPPSPTRRTAP